MSLSYHLDYRPLHCSGVVVICTVIQIAKTLYAILICEKRHLLRNLCAFHFCSFLARDVIYTPRAYATMSVSVCLSVTEVNWRLDL